MDVIILAAGYATRLYPLTENFPKPLLKVGGKTILDRLIEDLDDLPEIDKYILISNHKFVKHFSDWAKDSDHKNKITVIDDGTTENENRLGAVMDLKLAVPETSGDVLVLAGDNVLDFSLADFVRFALRNKTSAVMCHPENNIEKQRKTAIITKDESGLITSYEEKPDEPKGNLAVPPFYYYTSDDIKRLDEAVTDGCATDAPGSFAAWLSRKVPMHAWEMSGKRYDIGDIDSYNKAQNVFGS